MDKTTYDNIGTENLIQTWKCTLCGYRERSFGQIKDWNYCPKCGAKITRWLL